MMAISFGLRISDKDVAIFSANTHGLDKWRILCSSFVVTLKPISRYHLNGTWRNVPASLNWTPSCVRVISTPAAINFLGKSAVVGLSVLMCEVTFSNSLIIHTVISQSECPILVSWMYLDTQWKCRPRLLRLVKKLMKTLIKTLDFN